jgi:tryptophan halogenase
MEIEMSNDPVKKVVIVGGGTAGWVAAAVLSRTLGHALDIELVESDDIGTVGVGEATIPQVRLLLGVLGLDENDFLRRTNGTIKLGIQFNDWGRIGDSYMHAFGEVGRSLGMLPFYPYWLKNRAEGGKSDLWDYSFNYQSAIANRYAHTQRIGDTGMSGLVHAYHFDATLVAAFLREYAEKLGVKRTEGIVVDTNLRESDGFIETLSMASGEQVQGELFIDCSGFRGLLIEDALHTGYEDWTQWLPCNRAIAVPCEPVEPLQAYTQSSAHTAGWQWRIPLQNRIGNGHVYSSAYISDDEALSVLINNLDGEALAEPRFLKFTPGRRKKFWNKNCVALGLASGFMEPLESTAIYLVQSGINRLIKMFPNKGFSQVNTDEYNRQSIFEFERIRDFIILHYKANERTDSQFWIDRREMSVPAELTRKMDLFKDSGQIHRDAEELFTEVAWLQVLIGQHIIPDRHHPIADQLTAEHTDQFLEHLRQIIGKAVDGLPSHRDFINKNCAG